VPFLFSTNGEVIHFVDVRAEKYISRRISRFHTADGLDEKFGRDSGFEWFSENPVRIERLRPYQKKAIEAVESAVANGKRAMLVPWRRAPQDLHDRGPDLPLPRIQSHAAGAVPGGPRALAAQAVREFAAFTTPKGLKFDQEYDVFSQRFRREDFDDDKPYDPKVLPEATSPRPSPRTPSSTCPPSSAWPSTCSAGRARLRRPPATRLRGRRRRQARHPHPCFDAVIADECHRGTPPATPPPGGPCWTTSMPSRSASRRRRRPTPCRFSTKWPTATRPTRPSATATWWITTRSKSTPRSG